MFVTMGFVPRLFAVGSSDKWASAGGVVFDKKGRVALVKERKRSGLSRWTLPKGRLESGETVEEAAVREVREEAGVRARILGFLAAHEGKRSMVYYFRMVVTALGSPADPNVEAVRFVRPERAAELLRSDRDRRIVELGVESAHESVTTRGRRAQGSRR
jgi:ADP-ribose pyrophosphatase YjhB (NUDIX family)